MPDKRTVEPRNPKGMRDFLPAEKRVRDALLDKMIDVFEGYGFEPLETPPVELKETLAGKLGAEEKLIYDVSYKGDKELALRYDLTVPLARVVAQYPDLPKPFKRYQIGNAYRADNPQKGRFRQFLQVDIDTVGSSSPLADAEVIECAISLYSNLGFKDFKMIINSRPALLKLIKKAGIPDEKSLAAITALDKIKKIGENGVLAEMVAKDIEKNAIAELFELVRSAQPDEDLKKVFDSLAAAGISPTKYQFDPTLARGLDYYTGIIFECEVEGYLGGSVGGGGRYDNLIEGFSGQSTPAVGFSFGFEPTLDSMSEQGLLPEVGAAAKVLVTVFDEKLTSESFKLAKILRKKVPTELYSGSGDLEKQLKYADQKGIPYVAIVGPREANSNQVTIKDLAKAEQKTVTIEQALQIIS